MNKSSKNAKDAVSIEYGEDKQQYRTIFWKREVSEGCVTTWYGPRFIETIEQDQRLSVLEKAEAEQTALGASRLYKWEKPETRMKRGMLLGWGVSGDAWKLQHGEAARRKLQGKWNDSTKLLWYSVDHLLMHLDEFYDFEVDCSDGKRVCDVLVQAIKSGDVERLDLLAKVIESVHAASNRMELRRRIAGAVKTAAKEFNRVPTTEEIRQEFNNSRNPEELVEYPEKDFRKVLQAAGFGWIIPSRKTRKAPKA